MRATGAARGHGDASRIEGREQPAEFPLLAAESETQMAGQPLGRMSEDIEMRQRPLQSGGNRFAKLREPNRFVRQVFTRGFRRRSAADDAGNLFGRGTQSALPPATEHDRSKLRAFADI